MKTNVTDNYYKLRLQGTGNSIRLILLGMAVFLYSSFSQGSQDRPLSDQYLSEYSINIQGIDFIIIEGDVYKVDDNSNTLSYIYELYDNDYYQKNYTEIENKIYRKDPYTGQQKFEVKRYFEEDYENVYTIRDLVNIEQGWTDFVVQSPLTPTVPDYVSLRKLILRGESDFLDNRIEPSSENVHTGSSALKAYSVPKSDEMVTAKAFLGSEMFHYVRGDDVWFSGWYYIAEGGIPFTLWDLETTWYEQRPGIRLMLPPEGELLMELKWVSKKKYYQPKGQEVVFPTGEWVHIEIHLTLSDDDDGIIEVWQDGEKIIDTLGQTLLLDETIYNYLEIGITAHSYGDEAATLYVDDIVISDNAIEAADIVIDPINSDTSEDSEANDPISINLNQDRFSPWETLNLSLRRFNQGYPVTVNFYAWITLPDRETVYSVTDSGMTLGSLYDTRTLIPFESSVNLSTPFTLDDPEFFQHTWSGNELPGEYEFSVAVVYPEAFADGTMDPGDILVIDTVSSTFTGATANDLFATADGLDSSHIYDFETGLSDIRDAFEEGIIEETNSAAIDPLSGIILDHERVDVIIEDLADDEVRLVDLVVEGSGETVGENITHANGNVYNQVLLTGQSVRLQSDEEEITRVSFLDLNDDIVQVEFSGNAVVTISLDPDTFEAAATPVKYNQPSVNYVKGRASIKVEEADENTFMSIFTVGPINAVNQSLFRESEVYDGMADVSLLEITNSTGFGGILCANARFSDLDGEVGLKAPGIPVSVRVLIGDIDANGSSVPVLLFGEGSFTVNAANPGLPIAGGDLIQSNGSSIVIARSGSITPGFETLISQNNVNSEGIYQPTQSINATFSHADGREIAVHVEEMTID